MNPVGIDLPDGGVNGLAQPRFVGEDLMGKKVTFQMQPIPLDRIEFRRILGQPLHPTARMPVPPGLSY